MPAVSLVCHASSVRNLTSWFLSVTYFGVVLSLANAAAGFSRRVTDRHGIAVIAIAKYNIADTIYRKRRTKSLKQPLFLVRPNTGLRCAMRLMDVSSQSSRQHLFIYFAVPIILNNIEFAKITGGVLL